MMNILNKEKLTKDVEHKLMMLSVPKHHARPGYPKSKWYDLDGLKDTPTIANFRKLYEAASSMIDVSFFNVFQECQHEFTFDVVVVAVANVIKNLESTRHKFPNNEWKFTVMTYTLLRCRNLAIKIEDNKTILESFPEFRRQYGFERMGLETVMLYYSDTEKMMKRHQDIFLTYSSGKDGEQYERVYVPRIRCVSGDKYLTLPRKTMNKLAQLYVDSEYPPFTYWIFGSYDPDTKEVRYDFNNGNHFGTGMSLIIQSYVRTMWLPVNTKTGEIERSLVFACEALRACNEIPLIYMNYEALYQSAWINEDINPEKYHTCIIIDDTEHWLNYAADVKFDHRMCGWIKYEWAEPLYLPLSMRNSSNQEELLQQYQIDKNTFNRYV